MRKKLLKAAGLLALAPIEMYWKGFVLAVLWGWFLSPVFQIPEPSVLSCIGLLLVVGYIRGKFSDLKELEAIRVEMGETDYIIERLSFSFSYPAVILGLGWILKHFL